MSKWKVGDRVCRREDVYDRSSGLLRGTVIRVYSDLYADFGPYRELYEVEWDGWIRQGGFLPHGLDALFPNASVPSSPSPEGQP